MIHAPKFQDPQPKQYADRFRRTFDWKRIALFSVAAAAVVLTSPCVAPADVLNLKTGGRLVGKILNPEEEPRKSWQIQLLSGGLIALEVEQVSKPEFQSDLELRYEQLRAACPDMPESLWKLAEWCRKNNLDQERETHLKRIIELDTNFEEARFALGYTRFGDTWKTKRQAMEEQGYVLYQGRWRLPQEVQLMKRREARNLAEKEWFQKIKALREALGDEGAAAARQQILAIRSPDAIAALAQAMAEDPRRPARILYAEALGKIDSPGAHITLAQRAMTDPDEEVRLSCLDQLKGKDLPNIVTFFAAKLRSKDNREVNLAATGLRYVHNESAVRPLIDALVTTHKFQIVKSSPGSMSASFDSAGGGGLSMNEKPKIIARRIPNQAVLDTLVAITKMNFSYDSVAWNAWLAAATKRPDFDARRSE